MRVALAVLLLVCLVPAMLSAQTSRFRVEASFVKVPVAVSDSHGRPIVGLTRESFRVFDEGEERPIDNFVLDKAPVYVVLLLDVSGSVREEIEQIKGAAVAFARAFDREDRIAVMAFADELSLLQDWTNDVNKIRKSLKKVKPGYRTALFDALLGVRRNRFRGVTGRKVIIVLTDGMDNESGSGYETVLKDIVQSDVSLYIVSRTRLVLPQIQRQARVEFLNQVMKNVLKDDEDFVEVYFREKETAMEHLAESSGGRVLYPVKLTDLNDSYAQISRELKSQYLLTFQPPAQSDRRFRKITVNCSDPVAILHYRQQYAWSSPTGR
jgi:VWFA-related protein